MRRLWTCARVATLAVTLCYAGLLGTASAQPLIDSDGADETYLTIYPGNLAMVTEVRRMNLPKGSARLRLLGVSDQIISQTAVLQSFEGISLERNFDSDLITKGALMNSAVGLEITVRRINPASGEVTAIPAKLVSASQPPSGSYVQGAVFETPDGIEALDCAGLYETVLFSNLPNDLNPAPVLSMDVRSDSAGPKELTLSYLTQGLGWNADYRLDVNSAHTEGELSGWLTVTNSTSKSFKNVPTAIIAGELNHDHNTRGERSFEAQFIPTCWTQGSTKTGTQIQSSITSVANLLSRVRKNEEPERVMLFADAGFMDELVVTAQKRQAVREEFGDYKLYRTPQPVTVAAHQTKQIAFLSVPDAELERLHKFEFSVNNNVTDQLLSANIEYEIDNSKEGRLAQPLPRGTVRVMTTRANGQTAYLGEDNVRDLAVDLPVEISAGRSPSAQMRVEITGLNEPDTPYLRLSGDIFNAAPEAILAEIEIKDDRIRARQIGQESHPRDPEEIIPTYRISIPAESRETFFVDLPLQRTDHFDRSYAVYGSDAVGDTLFIRPTSNYALRGQSGSDNWATRYFDLPLESKNGEAVRAELLSKQKITTKLGEDRVRYSEAFTFTNPGSAPITAKFIYPSADHIQIIESSIQPTDSEDQIWTINISARQTKVLTVTAEADFVP